MVIVIAKLSVKPGKKQALLAAAGEVIAASRAEAGCVSYSLLDDPFAENRCTFVEEWADQAAIQLHFTTPHFAKWKQVSKEYLEKPSELAAYTAEKLSL